MIPSCHCHRALAALLAALPLVACGPGSEPTERDIRQAIDAASQSSEFSKGIRILYANVVIDTRIKVERVHKLYCEPGTLPDTLTCHVELTTRFAPGELPSETRRVRLQLVRKPGGWFLL